MYGVFLEKEKIEQLLRDFYTITEIRIAFISYDRKEHVAVKKSISDFCRILRSDKRADLKCRECDQHAFEKARNTGKLYIYQCHAGLTEAVAPIIVDGNLLGYLMLGQALKTSPEGREWEEVLLRCKRYDVNFAELKKAFNKLDYLSKEKIEAAARIMDMSAKYVHYARIVDLKPLQLIEKIKSFVDFHITQPISISHVSNALGISKSHLSRIIRKELGMTLTEYIQRKRIEKAQELLRKTDKAIGDIAYITGFADANYFARVFKKVVGCSPTSYRTKEE